MIHDVNVPVVWNVVYHPLCVGSSCEMNGVVCLVHPHRVSNNVESKPSQATVAPFDKKRNVVVARHDVIYTSHCTTSSLIVLEGIDVEHA